MTAPLAALLAAAWTLIFVLGVWSVVGPYLRDRKRAEGVSPEPRRTGKPPRLSGPISSAGRRSETPAPPEIRAGGPT